VFCYCNSCWQKYTLARSSIFNAKQVKTLNKLNSLLQQQLDSSRHQNTLLQQQLTASEQNCAALQEQLTISRNESRSYKDQLGKMDEKYNKLSNTSGIAKLRDFLNQLTSSQIEALHIHTKFRVDTFEAVYSEQQRNCSSQFVTSTMMQLKSSVDELMQIQTNTLSQRKQTKESIFQTLVTNGVSRVIIHASVKPLETEIEQIQANIKGWHTFSDSLINEVEQQPLLVLYLKQST
jgi:chromosome segregation ATPase